MVATGSMLIHDGVAQLGPGTTLEARPRSRLQHAAAAPPPARRRTRRAATRSSPSSGNCDPDRISVAGRNLLRAGFEEAYKSNNWQRPALHPARVS